MSFKFMVKKYLLLVISIALVASCSTNERRYNFDKVEVVVYYWKYGIRYYDLHTLRGKLFATIDSTGNCKMIESYSGVTRYKNFLINDSLLIRLDASLSCLPSDLDMHPPLDKPIIYDGPKIRVIYYLKNVKRIVDFLASERYSEQNCLLVYNLLNKLNRESKYKTFSDTIGIKQQRMKQLEAIYDKFYLEINRAASDTFVIQKPRLIE